VNKLIIFDLDGVLIDSKEIHFNSLNLALQEFDKDYIITKTEQENIFEGLTTRSKLKILTQIKGLPEPLYEDIWRLKQEYSSKLFESISIDKELINLFKLIKSSNIKIAVASNSIRKTLDTCLSSLGIAGFIDYSMSNEDVLLPKPNPEMYNRCMKNLGVTPKNTVIFEDSEIGLKAANATGAAVQHVKDRKNINFDRIKKAIEYLNGN
jgi:HAD superfamily hydrolase (TIGR01509 family)